MNYNKLTEKSMNALQAAQSLAGENGNPEVTETHLLLLDFRKEEFTGKDMSDALAKAGIIANFNMVPGDQRKPAVTSGVRMGTGALTTMGMKEKDMEQVASWIIRIVRAMPDASDVSAQIRGEVAEYCKQFKVPGLWEA